MAKKLSTWKGKFSLTFVILSFFYLAAVHQVATGGTSKSMKSKLDGRVSQLLEWSTRKAIITLSSDKFNTYVKTKPRNYSVIATFTALKPQRQCSICREAYDEFTMLANSWRYSQQYSSEIFFVMVDIDEDGMDIFQQMHLSTAPTYFHFPSTGKRKSEDKWDIARNGYTADALGKWVTERTGITITILRPPNYTLLMIWIPIILIASVVGYLKRENLYMLYDTRYWAVAAIIWILVMISGQMWNHIRGPPFAHRNPQTGEMGYFSGTSQYQFIAETYFIIVLYGIMALGMILLNEKFAIFEESGMQKFMPIVGLILVVLDFGYLLSIFRMKYHGYPYSNFAVYCCLLCLSVLLSLQVDGIISWSFGIIFIPLWAWNTLTLTATALGVVTWIRKKRLRRERENRKYFIAMVQSSVLQFFLFITEVLIAVNLDLNSRLSWSGVFGPLYVLVIISIGACVISCCIKRCNIELELLGFVNILQLVFLGIRLDGVIMWQWAVVLIPTWILLILVYTTIVLYTCFKCCLLSIDENIPDAQLKKTLTGISIVFFSLSTVTFTLFLVLIVLQLDGKLSAPYTATFVPLHISILSLFPTTLSRGPANLLWFGIRKNFVEFVLELCPFFKEYMNVSWTKGTTNQASSSVVGGVTTEVRIKNGKKLMIPSIVCESKDYPYENIMIPD